ncbi:polysaccharide pyruvyl transferase family protein [Oculatella sp. FACHB-28]|uniref:polysaccharide pyruvyl transferase family protein n=1 Tax=Oculatella sp. FACHB-28 TaxID=2692845 RepID=UPI00168A3583|nr:polysaccharide pyruvyl transferase family protein [Oculatella sp. FACHB-28]MBD2060104.1 polysaccharide pyruvyl transferase family protein [Oculatella sp. FACHB-28]
MKLCYYKLPNGAQNFGDNLNPWLWEKLLPGVLDDDPTTAFVGIGTLFNNTLPDRTRHARKRAVFGTGVGYAKGVPAVDDSYKIYCLRGPLSTKALGLADELAVTDGAVLLRRLVKPGDRKRYKFAFMPHYELAGEGWKSVCEAIGFGHIDPRWTTEAVITAIGQTEVVLAEAMHGAIVADALRVPWVPVVTSPTILSFKWQDWCASVGVEYQPVQTQRVFDPRKKTDLLTPVSTVRHWLRVKSAASRLKQLALRSRPILSTDNLIEQRTVQLEERLQQFKDDVAAGYFTSPQT